MKDKEKQIEEMADIIFNSKYKNDYISPLKGANELYNKGYRKIPEDSVVLTREGYNALLLEQKRLKEIEDRIPCGYELKDKTRKETAREIIEKVKQALNHLDNEWEISNALYLIEKQYGVDLGE